MIDVAGRLRGLCRGADAADVSALKEIDRKRRKVEREVGETRFTARSASRADFERLIELKRDQYRATGQTDVLRAPAGR